MRFEHFVFGSIRIDGRTYEHDVVFDLARPCGKRFGHEPARTWRRSS
jgi:hypothetical protein